MTEKINKKKFENPGNDYVPYCFFFINDEFEKNHLLNMLNEMEDKGFSMGYIQNRGMKGKKFLSKEFFDTYESIAQNAKLPLGFCDEIGGMYGASSMVDEMPRGTSLKWETVEKTEQYTIPVCFFAVSCEKDNGLIKTKTLELKNEGDIVDAGKTIYLFQKYHDKSTSGSDMDYLNSKSADIVIECVYEKFKEYCGEYFGKEITGAFMDIEGDFGYKLAYSDRLKEVYEEMYGENIFVTLPLLFEEDTQGRWMRARYRWYEAVAKTYGEFYDKLVNWCESNNLKFNAHTWEENLYGQVMQIGDFYHVNRKFSITGTDSLRLECYKPRDFKESLTIADKENKRYMCEVFAAAGNALSASEIKKGVSYMTAWGIDHIIFHGIHTNRNRGAISFAPDTFDNNTYWEGFSQISDYIKRTSYINHITNVCADTVVLNPIDSIKSLLGDYVLDRKNSFFKYISEQREMLLCKHGLEMKEIEDEYTRVINELTKKHIEFYIYDNNYFLNEDFTNIKNIIIPAMSTISKEVLQKIVSLSKEGKKIYFTGRTPYASTEEGRDDSEVNELLFKIENPKTLLDIKSDITLLSESFDYIVSHRRQENTHYLWMLNETDLPQNARFKVKGINGEVKLLNCETGEEKEVYYYKEDDGTVFCVNFEANEGFFIVIKESKNIALNNWKITYNDKTFETAKLVDWRNWGIENYSGFVKYETEFAVDDFENVILALNEVYHVAKVNINENELPMKMWKPYEFDITSFVKKGENKLIIEVGNLYSNSLSDYGYHRWQDHIHRQNPIDSYNSGIIGNAVVRIQ